MADAPRARADRPTAPAPSRSRLLPLHRGDVEAAQSPAVVVADEKTAGVVDAAAATAAVTPTDTPTDAQPSAPTAGQGATAKTTPRRSSSHLQFRLRAEGDSGRSGFHVTHFARIAFRSSSRVSMAVNVLWPVVPAAIACRYALDDSPRSHLVVFVLAYIAMVPCANLIGFAGQELSRKVPHVLGVLTETTVASIVEIVLFMVLLRRGLYAVIQAAILGSVLATMLLCLGMCFLVGGIRLTEQEFSETVSEVGNGLLLTAGFGLAVPTLFQHTLSGTGLAASDLAARTLNVSHSSAILLIISYLVFIYFQTRTHHGIYDAIFEGEETRAVQQAAEHVDRHDGAHPGGVRRRLRRLRRRLSRGAHTGSSGADTDSISGSNTPPMTAAARAAAISDEIERDKLTLTESLLALAVAVALVSLIAVSLVEGIEFMVAERHVSDAFMGLILVPLVEKAAEHLTAIDEAWDNRMNFAVAHVLGATLQTIMFNGPLAVIVGWGLDRPLGLDFAVFDMAVLLLAIITVGNFLRDQKSNYLEGLLCVIVYFAIAVAAFNYPNHVTEDTEAVVDEDTAATVGHAVRHILQL